METEHPQFGIGTLVQHGYLGIGRVVGYDGPFYIVNFKAETKNVPFSYKEMKAVESSGDAELDRIRSAVREVLGDYGWIESELELGKRWVGGTIRILPGKENTQPKEIPLDGFFKKVIGVREKLRVLEQKINNHPKLDSIDKLELEGYITRCYGSLTTFNALFADKNQHFVGSGSGGDSDG
jgi:hypothetical protein